ncbi:hypothetical protein RINTHH_10060 [Richelia intracellularis HH01]|uniref:Uncharacterized protein n=1 Tax=Richelia intracellularis HH01 TaxID=1165094 RepID=M1X583_9NOST|nr:hypothetical protein RINTHH_10060 [Richelia intracellularis HH01]
MEVIEKPVTITTARVGVRLQTHPCKIYFDKFGHIFTADTGMDIG